MQRVIAPIFRERRRELHLTQAEVARRSGMHQSDYSKIEHGTIDPRLSTFQDIARSLSLELVLVPSELSSVVQALIARQDVQSTPLFKATGD